MLEPGTEPDLPEEARRTQRGGELGMHDLERDRAVVLQVVGEPDRGHAAAAELAVERVAVGQRVAKQSFGSGQGRDLGGVVWNLPARGAVARR